MRITLLLIIFSVLSFSETKAQANRARIPPYANTQESFNALYSFKPIATYGAYWGTWTPANQGTQLDTACAACRESALKLGTVKIIHTPQSTTGLDTTAPSILNGQGKITFSWQAWHASTTSTANPTCVGTLYQSNDMLSWVPVSGASVQTLTPTAVYSNSVTPACNSWTVDRAALFYALGVAVTVDTASIQAQYLYIKNQQFQY